MRVAVSLKQSHVGRDPGFLSYRVDACLGSPPGGKEACGIAALVAEPRNPGLKVQSDQMITLQSPDRFENKANTQVREEGGQHASAPQQQPLPKCP